MKLKLKHDWSLSPSEAVALQQRLRREVVTDDSLETVRRLAGVDVGFEQNGAVSRAAICVLSYPELALIDSAIARLPTTFPYRPGLLSFREIPVILAAVGNLQVWPDLWLCDGQGIAHPRRFGIASHLGVLLDVPTIGVAKSRLCGRHAEVPVAKGHWVSLRAGDEQIGAVLRTRARVKPLYISSGHRISLPTAVDYVMGCITRYRLPETTRHAHRLASQK